MYSGSPIGGAPISAVLDATIADVEPPVQPTFIDGTVSYPLTWIEWHNEDPHAYAEVDLNDRASYYMGYKRATVIQGGWAKVTRGLSDWQGQIEHLVFGALHSDTDRRFRGQLGDGESTRFLTNRPRVVRMIDDEERRIEGTPRVVANGFLIDYSTIGGLKFSETCSDFVRRKHSRQRKSLQHWHPLIRVEDFDPNTTPQDALNKPGPVIYGALTSSTGAYAPIYTGIRLCPDAVYRSEFLIACHACKGIPTGEIYIDGVQVAASPTIFTVPFTAEWTAALFPHAGYFEINGFRYFTMYVDRAAAIALNLVTADELSLGSARLTINIQGIESVGDGTGSLITSLVLQCQHFAENALAPNRPFNTQAWVGIAPLYFSAIPELTYVDRASFADVDGLVGLDGAGVIGWAGEGVGDLDVLARFCLSGDFEVGFSRLGQLIASREPDSAPVDPEDLDDVKNILAETLTIRDNVTARFFNIQPYRWGQFYDRSVDGGEIFEGGVRLVIPSHGGWQSTKDGETDLRDAASISNYDQEVAASSLDLYFLRNSTDAQAIAQRRLDRYKNPLRVVSLEVPLSGTNVDLGDVFTVTAIEGISDSGWTDRPLRCTRHELDPNQNTVTLDAYDIQRVWDA